MGTQATISIMNANTLRAWSSAMDEPRWLLERRMQALELAGTLALPDVEKIKLEKWDLTNMEITNLRMRGQVWKMHLRLFEVW